MSRAFVTTLCAALLFAGIAHSESPWKSDPRYAPVRSFLGKQDKIRMFIAKAPGFGHQSATVSLMQHVRELGFTGDFEVVFEDSQAVKLAHLIPPGLRKRMTLEPLSTFQKREVDDVAVAMTGGMDDERVNAKFAHSNFFIKLQPQGWLQHWAPTGIDVRQGKFHPLPELVHLGSLYEVAPKDPDALVRLVHEEMNVSHALRSKVDGLSTLFRALDAGERQEALPTRASGGSVDPRSAATKSSEMIDVLPVYDGWPVGQAKRLTKIVGAARDAAASLKSPVVIPVLSVLHRDVSDRLRKKSDKPAGVSETLTKALGRERLHFAKIENADDLRQSLRALAPGEVLVVEVGTVSKNVFDQIFAQATLPVVVEGKNSNDLARRLGKPFISTYHADERKVALKHDLPRRAAPATESANVVQRAHLTMWDDDKKDFGTLTEFLIAGKLGKLSGYYSALSPWKDPFANDKAAQALAETIALDAKSEAPTH